MTCKSFTRDFYKLNFPSESTRSLQSPAEDALTAAITSTTSKLASIHFVRDDGDADVDNDTDSDTDDGSIRNNCRESPTPSEAGLALVTSCSSTDSNSSEIKVDGGQVLVARNFNESPKRQSSNLSAVWRQSNGWRRVIQQVCLPFWPSTSTRSITICFFHFQPASAVPSSPSMIPKRKESRIPSSISVRRARNAT